LRVQYFKYFDKESNAECILKYEKNVKNIEDESFFLNYKLYIVLVKEHGVYKKIGLSNDTISMLETSSSKETMRVDFEGYSGKNLQINNYKNFNFRGKGLFTYLASVILNDIFKLLEPSSDCIVHFPDNKLTSNLEYDEENYKRRNRAYEKLGFNIEFNDDEKITGFILDTNIGQLNLNTTIPSNLTLYDSAIELINDAIELVQFANDVARPFIRPYSAFLLKETYVEKAIYDVTKVIGTDHSRYYNRKWIDIINNMERKINTHDLSLEYDKAFFSIGFYERDKTNEILQDPWGIIVYDNNAFIAEGNHRTCISKFLHALGFIDKEMTGLRYVKYLEYDHKAERQYNAIKKWLKKYYLELEDKFIVNVVSQKVENEKETITISRPKYIVNFHIYNLTTNERKHKDFYDIEKLKIYLRNEVNLHRENRSFKLQVLKKEIKRKLRSLL